MTTQHTMNRKNHLWRAGRLLFTASLAAAVSLSLGACGTEDGNDGKGGNSTVDGGSLDGAGMLDGSGATDTSGAGDIGQPDDATNTMVGLSQEDKDLIYLREEEKLARDVYLTLYDKWQLNPHKNIAASEQTHTDKVKDLLLKRGLTDPVKDDTVGVFENPTLAKLYTDLVALGSKSEVDALLVGATIEDLDIFDIEEMKKHTTDPEIMAVYTSLACGSRNHMRSFTNQLKNKGATYTAQYLTAPELSAILQNSNETCGDTGGSGGGGKGGGGGGGQGGGGPGSGGGK